MHVFSRFHRGGITQEGLHGAHSHFKAGAMHYGIAWDTHIILELQKAVKSVKRSVRLPLQVGHKGSELAACLPRGHGLAGWRGLPIPAPPDLRRFPSRVSHPTMTAMADTPTECVRVQAVLSCA